jgi:hypothetical protein
MPTVAIGMVRRLVVDRRGSNWAGHRYPCCRCRAGGTSTDARQGIPRRNLRFLCGVWPGRTPVEGMGTLSEPLSQPPRCGSVPAHAEADGDGRGRERARGRGRSSLRLWRWLAVGSFLMDASRWPAAPGGTGALSRFRILPRRCWPLPEGADGDGDGVKDVNGPADAVFGAASYLRQLRSGTRTRHLKTLWLAGPGGMPQEPLRAPAALRFSLGLRPALDPPRETERRRAQRSDGALRHFRGSHRIVTATAKHGGRT